MAKRYRDVIFTGHICRESEYDGSQYIDRPKLENPLISYYVIQRELGDKSKNLHYQGYIEFTSQISLKTLKTLIPNAHWEARKGTQKQAIDYCQSTEKKGARDINRLNKKGEIISPGPWELGTPKSPGTRTDVLKVRDIIAKGGSNHDLFLECPNALFKYSKGVAALRAARLPPPPAMREIKVSIFWGIPGSGKTYAAFQADPNLFVVNDDAKWWDGYDGQNTILFDEFKGDIPIINMNKYLDKYKLRLPIKGGFVDAYWTRVIICSNIDWLQWYPYEREIIKSAFYRRIHHIQHFEEQYRDDHDQQELSQSLTAETAKGGAATLAPPTGSTTLAPNVPESKPDSIDAELEQILKAYE